MSASGLGPHVVGQRVVVRRRLADGSATDLLGLCTAWEDGTVVVAPETGPPVSIPLTDVIAGKPVPPRPPARHRVSAPEAQRRALALFPDIATEPLGPWLVRTSASSPARRANSVLAFAPGDDDLVAQVVDRYEALGRRPIAAVRVDSEEEALFHRAGWVPESGEAATAFQMGSVSRALRSLADPPGYDVQVRSDADGLLVARFGDDAGGVAAVDGDWVGLRSIEVSPHRRRHGLGVAVVAALLEHAAERGALTAYLQVHADNVPALGLYERLGFTTHHLYGYLVPG